MPSGIVSPDVVQNLAEGSSEAFRTIYDHYKDRTYYFLLKFCKNPDTAEELLQSLFVKLWERRKKLRTNTNFEAFLFTIAKHHAIDFLKSRSREQFIELHELCALEQGLNTTEQELYFTELRAIANNAIESLPEKRQIIFRMNQEEGLNPSEIAQMLGLSLNTVKVQLNKANHFIRAYVRTNGEVTLLLLLWLQS